MESNRHKVVVTGGVFHSAGLEKLRAHCDAAVWDGPGPIPRATLLEWLRDADALVPSGDVRVDAELLRHAPRLKVIAQSSVGYDNVDIAACAAAGVPFGNTPGVLVNATADLTFALILLVMRRIAEACGMVQAGRWVRGAPVPFGRDLEGKTLGIVGLGSIGAAVARRAQASGMVLAYHNRRRSAAADALPAAYLPFDELLRTADCVVALTPLSEQTRRLFGERAFRLMKPGAFFVNAARGGVVDTDALYGALCEGRLAGAALDVTDPEPLPADHPLIALPNVVISPHIGSATHETRARMAELTADNILLGLAGRALLTPVNA